MDSLFFPSGKKTLDSPDLGGQGTLQQIQGLDLGLAEADILVIGHEREPDASKRTLS